MQILLACSSWFSPIKQKTIELFSLFSFTTFPLSPLTFLCLLEYRMRKESQWLWLQELIEKGVTVEENMMNDSDSHTIQHASNRNLEISVTFNRTRWTKHRHTWRQTQLLLLIFFFKYVIYTGILLEHIMIVEHETYMDRLEWQFLISFLSFPIPNDRLDVPFDFEQIWIWYHFFPRTEKTWVSNTTSITVDSARYNKISL